VTALSYAAGPALAQEAPKEQKQGGQASPQGPKTSPQPGANLPAYSASRYKPVKLSSPGNAASAMDVTPQGAKAAQT